MLRLLLGHLAMASILPAQSAPATAGNQKDIELLKKQIAKLSSDVERLNKELTSLRTTNRFLSNRVTRLESNEPSAIEIDPANSKGYSLTKGAAGPLLIALEEAVPYLDGYKIRLKVGNPS